MKTRTAPWDYNRGTCPSQIEREIAALPYRWWSRWSDIFFGQPWPATITQRQAYEMVLAEMHPDDCSDKLPEQQCAACRAAITISDEELPY